MGLTKMEEYGYLVEKSRRLSEELLIDEARRREVFENLGTYLRRLVEVVKGLDPSSEVYLFGSVAEGRYLLSSDIDVLVVADANPGKVLAELWLAGIRDPFEIHVVARKALELYRRRSKLVRVEPHP